MLSINEIIETALALDALQTHVDDNALGIDANMRTAMMRCIGTALGAIAEVKPKDPDADLDDTLREVLTTLGAYKMLAAVYGGSDAARADFYEAAARDTAEAARAMLAARCPSAHTPSWT